MRKILVPFDGSESAVRAVHYAAALATKNPDLRLELLNVQDPTAVGEPGSAEEKAHIRQIQFDEAERVLQPAKQILNQAQLEYEVRGRVGVAAEEIAKHARENGCESIIMGTRGMSPLKTFVIGSVATCTVQFADVPVTLIK